MTRRGRGQGLPIGRLGPGTRRHLQAFASPFSRASLHLRPGGAGAPVGSVAWQPSHQICIAATVINGYATICLSRAARRRAARAAKHDSALLRALFGKHAVRYWEPINLCNQDSFGLLSIQAISGRRSDPCGPSYSPGQHAANYVAMSLRNAPGELKEACGAGNTRERRPARVCYKPSGWRPGVWFASPCR